MKINKPITNQNNSSFENIAGMYGMDFVEIDMKPKIAFIGTDWNTNEYRRVNNKPGAISTYRLIYPMSQLSEWYDCDYFGSDFSPTDDTPNEVFFEEFFQKYDLVVTKVTDNPQAAAMLLFFAQRNGVPLVVDIDDNIWELKKDQPGYKFYAPGSVARSVASAYISSADAVFASTQPLGDYVKHRVKDAHKKNMPVYVLPNCVDPSDYNFKPAELDPKKIVIGWQGSTTHHEDLKIAMPAIGKLMQEYPNMYLELLGGVEEKMVADLFANMPDDVLLRTQCKPGVPAFDTFPHLLSEQAWDIAIAPLTDETFNHAKSHIKWMEYAMYNIPCVASKVYPYFMPIQGTNTIIDGDTGYISEPDEWYEKLKYLIDNPKERIRVGTSANWNVIKDWHIKKHAEKWKEAIDTLLENR